MSPLDGTAYQGGVTSNSKVKIKEKDGVITKTTVTKQNGVTTTVTETTYPDGSRRTTTETKSRNCGVPLSQSMVLGVFVDTSKNNTSQPINPVVDEKNVSLFGQPLQDAFANQGVVKPGDIVDRNGKIKDEYKIFDLNGDGRLADNEFSWFANGGVKKSGAAPGGITANNMNNSIMAMDTNLGTTKADGIITAEERLSLHSMLDAPERFY